MQNIVPNDYELEKLAQIAKAIDGKDEEGATGNRKVDLLGRIADHFEASPMAKKAEYQAASTADTVAGAVDDLNSLIAKLIDAGVMTGDDFTITVNNSVTDAFEGHADRTYNTGKISGVAESDGVITITLSAKVDTLKDFDGGNGWGVYKWLGIGVSAGVTPITGLKFNGTQLTSDDVDEATAMGLSAGYFVLWVKADQIINGKSNKFKLWASGYNETEYTLKIVEPS